MSDMNIDGIRSEIILDLSSAIKQLERMIGELGDLKKDLGKTDQSFKDTAKVVATMTARLDDSGKAISALAARIMGTSAALDTLEKEAKPAGKAVDDLGKKTRGTGKEMERLDATAEGAAASLNEVEKETREADKQLERLDKTARKSARSVDAVGRESRDAGRDLGKFGRMSQEVSQEASTHIGTLLAGFHSLRAGIAGAGAALTGGALYEAARSGAGMEAQRAAFENVIGSLSKAAEMMEQLRRASGFAVSEEALRRFAIRAEQTGISLEKLAKLVEIARAAAVAYGRDQEETTTRVIEAVSKRERELLDEVGIIVGEIEAQKRYAAAVGRSADSLSEAEKTQAFLNETLRQGEFLLTRVGDATGGTASEFAKFETSVGAAWRATKGLLADAVEPLIRELNDLEEAMAGVGEAQREALRPAPLGTSLDQFRDALGKLGSAEPELARLQAARETAIQNDDRYEAERLSGLIVPLERALVEARTRVDELADDVLKKLVDLPADTLPFLETGIRRIKATQAELDETSKKIAALREQMKNPDIQIAARASADVEDAERALTGLQERLERRIEGMKIRLRQPFSTEQQQALSDAILGKVKQEMQALPALAEDARKEIAKELETLPERAVPQDERAVERLRQRLAEFRKMETGFTLSEAERADLGKIIAQYTREVGEAERALAEARVEERRQALEKIQAEERQARDAVIALSREELEAERAAAENRLKMALLTGEDEVQARAAHLDELSELRLAQYRLEAEAAAGNAQKIAVLQQGLDNDLLAMELEFRAEKQRIEEHAAQDEARERERRTREYERGLEQRVRAYEDAVAQIRGIEEGLRQQRQQNVKGLLDSFTRGDDMRAVMQDALLDEFNERVVRLLTGYQADPENPNPTFLESLMGVGEGRVAQQLEEERARLDQEMTAYAGQTAENTGTGGAIVGALNALPQQIAAAMPGQPGIVAGLGGVGEMGSAPVVMGAGVGVDTGAAAEDSAALGGIEQTGEDTAGNTKKIAGGTDEINRQLRALPVNMGHVIGAMIGGAGMMSGGVTGEGIVRTFLGSLAGGIANGIMNGTLLGGGGSAGMASDGAPVVDTSIRTGSWATTPIESVPLPLSGKTAGRGSAGGGLGNDGLGFRTPRIDLDAWRLPAMQYRAPVPEIAIPRVFVREAEERAAVAQGLAADGGGTGAGRATASTSASTMNFNQTNNITLEGGGSTGGMDGRALERIGSFVEQKTRDVIVKEMRRGGVAAQAIKRGL